MRAQEPRHERRVRQLPRRPRDAVPVQDDPGGRAGRQGRVGLLPGVPGRAALSVFAAQGGRRRGLLAAAAAQGCGRGPVWRARGVGDQGQDWLGRLLHYGGWLR